MKKLFILSLFCSVGLIGSSYAQTVSTSGSLSIYSPPDGDQLEDLELYSIAPVNGLVISLDAVASSLYGSHATAMASSGALGTFVVNSNHSNQYNTKEIFLSFSGTTLMWLSVFAHEDSYASASFSTY